MTRSNLNKIAKELEGKIKTDYPTAAMKWTMPFTKNKDGSAGGRLHVKIEGYHPRTMLINVMADGRWWTA